jgi:hypothetical protein
MDVSNSYMSLYKEVLGDPERVGVANVVRLHPDGQNADAIGKHRQAPSTGIAAKD